MSGCGCNGDALADLDSRTLPAIEDVLAEQPGQLGPGLGGGIVGANIAGAFSIPQIGGGLTAAVRTENTGTPVKRAPFVLQQFAFDYSTPQRKNDPPMPGGPLPGVGSWRELGGMIE